MRKILLTLPTFGLLAGCAESSETLSEFGSFRKVSDNWYEHFNPIQGPADILAYTTSSEAYDAKIIMSCENANHIFGLAMGGGVNRIENTMQVTVKLDSGKPFQMDFTARKGDEFFRPGDGSYQASEEFIDKLAGSDRLVIQFDTWMREIKADEPAKIFNIQGSGEIEFNLGKACAAQSG